MRWFRSNAGALIAGVALVVAAAALLAALGTFSSPLREASAGSASLPVAGTTVADLSGGPLTPAEIYDRSAPGVVEVLATFPAGQGGHIAVPAAGSSQSLGSGFVAGKDGSVLTSAHVVARDGVIADAVSIVFKDGEAGMTRVAAKIVGVDETSDIALLEVDPADAPILSPLTLGDSSTVRPGQSVVAIGNPLGYDFSVTSGIVSAINRNLESPNGAVIPNGIQTDAAINSGNSGGPLLDASGVVIGINEQIASQSGGNQGLGFAVPINTAKRVMEQLRANGKVTYAYLGVQGQSVTADVSEALGIDAHGGVLVAAVAPDSPAAKAGVRGGERQVVVQHQTYVLGGDVVSAVDGKAVAGAEELAAAIMEHEPGDVLALTVVRDGAAKDVKVTLGERPDVTS